MSGRAPSIVICCWAALAVSAPATASEFIDLRGSDANTAQLTETWFIGLAGDPGRLDVILPRAESLDAAGEIAYYGQSASVIYNCTPPANLEDRSEWYTVLSWYPGRLTGWSEVQIEAVTSIANSGSLPGIGDDLSRLPGDYYTSYTQSIEHVQGIEDAIRFLDATPAEPGYPSGDVGLAQRWLAYIFGVIQPGSCDAAGQVDGAAWAWNAGVADCDGLANIFASGMRTLGIPTCVMMGFAVEGGPEVDGTVHWHGTNYHSWAGVWSEGLGRFVPVDQGLKEFGFLDCQRLHLDYLEDMTDYHVFLDDTNNTAHWTGLVRTGSGSIPSTHYPDLRVRRIFDGVNRTFLAHNIVGANAPGGVSAVADLPGSESRPAVRVSNPFRETLSVSLTGASGQTATVELFDVQGRRVACLAQERRIGEAEAFFRWLPRGEAPGAYFVKVSLSPSGRILLGRAVRSP